jgi:hypothetical protein
MSERRNSLSTIITADNRKEILFEMFGDIGELEEGNTTIHFTLTVWVLPSAVSICKTEDFSCALDTAALLIHGRMYFGSKAVCFFSNLLGNERNIKIPYSTIKWYSKQMTALIFPNAIEVITNGSGGKL